MKPIWPQALPSGLKAACNWRYYPYLATKSTGKPFSKPFFNPFFHRLAGSDKLRSQIAAGWDEARIRAGWQPALKAYRARRSKYLLYPD